MIKQSKKSTEISFPVDCFRYACFLLVFFSPLAGTLLATDLPAGFSETRIADDLNPTTMVFAPDGRLFLCEKQGRILVIENGSVLPTPLIDFSDKVDSWNERGLNGICLDPDFPHNGYVYLYYTAKSPSHNRVSRFTVSGNTAPAASEKVILDITELSSIGWHNGGGLCFGKDGKLYIATGENADGSNAQNTSNLLGKILRVNADGSIPANNPNYKTFTGTNRAIVALGLRNPFALAAHPTSGLIYINDVGAKYEQVERYDSDVTPISINYGWPKFDGPLGRPSTLTGYRDPEYAYDHGSGEGTALCGGGFYALKHSAPAAFPPNYHGVYFFTDYRGWIKYIDPANPGKRFDFAKDINRPIDVKMAPDGSLWYIARAGKGGGSDSDNTATTDGSLWRIYWTGSGGPTKLEFSTQPSSQNVGGTLAPALRVAVQDSKGNTFTYSNAPITIAISNNSGSAILGGTLTRNAVDGIATFNDLHLDRPGSGYQLRCTSADLKSRTTNSFDIAAKVSAPTITPRSGTYTDSAWVQISSATGGARVRYTSDGTEPTSLSAVYSEPFQITGTSIIKAFAETPGLSNSDVSMVELSIVGKQPYGIDYRAEVTGVKMPPHNGSGIPKTLAGTGFFKSVGNLAAKPGVIPYDVNSPLWSDGAQKFRWVALPDRSQIGFAADGEYQWPGGTVFVKHFELVTNEQTKAKRRLETRLLVLDPSGGNGYGVTYKWRSDESGAELLTSGLDEQIDVIGKDGRIRSQVWHYPSQEECLQCHTTKSGFVLGANTRQLNSEFRYPSGRTDNQIRTWNYLQMFTSNVHEGSIEGYKRLVKLEDAGAGLEDRVRSYWDSNCAFCHRPGGTGSQWDARYDTPLIDQNSIQAAVRETYGIADAKVVAPGDLPKSIMHLRMISSQATQRMPPVGRNVVDTTAVNAISKWIESLPKAKGSSIVSGQVYYLTAKHSNKRLEIPVAGIHRDGTGAQQWSDRSSSKDGDRNQQWRFDDMGGGSWRLINVASGKALDVPNNSNANSVQLQQYSENGGDNQLWAIAQTGDGYFTITSKQSGKNLDVDGANTDDGAEVHQFQHSGNDNQCWGISAHVGLRGRRR